MTSPHGVRRREGGLCAAEPRSQPGRMPGQPVPLSADDLKGELLELARYGRVLVLLDAAIPAPRRWTARRSPSMRMRCAPAWPRRTVNRADLVQRQRDLGGARELAARRVHQSAAGLVPRPRPRHQPQRLISTTGLATYLNRRVPTLTDGKQTPGMESPVRHHRVRGEAVRVQGPPPQPACGLIQDIGGQTPPVRRRPQHSAEKHPDQ